MHSTVSSNQAQTHIFIWFWLLASAIFFPLTSAAADEPALAYLQALRENGFHDVALLYLESAANNPSVSPAFKKTIPFERAETLIGSTARLRDPKVVNRRLDEAQTLLEQYASTNREIKESARTFQYSGRLYQQRAELLFQKADSDRLTAGEKNALFQEARQLLVKARENTMRSQALLVRLLDPNSEDAIRIDPDDPSTLDVRKQLQRNYMQVTVMLPNVIESLADTFPSEDPKKREYLLEANDRYMKVWDKYKRYAPGIQACVYAGRVNQKLGEHKTALDRFKEIFALGSGGSLKRFKKQAYVLATDSWSKLDPVPVKEIIFALDPVVRSLNRSELRERDWLKVQLALAEAKYAQAKVIKASGKPNSASDAKAMERAAAKLLRSVSRVPSPLRDRAKQLLSQWNVPLVDAAEEKLVPTNFVDALQQARDKIAELEAIANEKGRMTRALATTANPDMAEQLQAVTDDLTAQSGQAIEALELAMTMTDAETPRSDITTVRYLQSFVYFAAGDYYHSALLGEHLLRHYPNEAGAKQASNYTIQSLSKLLDKSGGKSAFCLDHLTWNCNEALQRFPGSNEAGVAASTMSKISLVKKQPDEAAKYFEKIPESYASRGPIALRLGQIKWLAYKKGVRENGNSPEAAKELEAAIRFMKIGVESIDPKQAGFDTAVGALMYVDALVVANRIELAVKNLESTPLAPLDLIKLQHPAVSKGPNRVPFRQEAYTTAIKVYLSAMRQDTNRQRWVDKASGVLEEMKTLVAPDDEKGQKKLTAVYQLIAQELKDGFDGIDLLEEKVEYAKTLEAFLTWTNESSEDPKTVLWAGSTMFSVADTLAKAGGAEQARPMMDASVDIFTRAEKLGLDKLPNAKAMQLELARQRALAKRGLGNFEEAVEDFKKILAGNKTPVSFQIDAASTLQEWGITKGLKDPIALATNGTGKYEDKKTKKTSNAIWGWKRLRAATLRDKKYRDIYYTAMFNIIEGRYEYGKIDNSQKAIASALKEIVKERTKDPTFNGMDKWKKRFTDLERKIKAKR